MVFKSKYKRHKIILEPSKKLRIGDGFEFKKGVSVQFENNIYRTNDKDIIAVLTKLSKKLGIEKISEKVAEEELKSKKPTTK